MSKFKLKELPLKEDIESKKVLKALPMAHAALAELKGLSETISDQNILFNTLSLQEAKDSSEIENIITTYDELYKSEITTEQNKLPLASKEVQNYVSAMQKGYIMVKKHGFLSCRIICDIQQELEQNSAGFRKLPGTVLKNDSTGEVVYEPPQNPLEIQSLMNNFEAYINDSDLCAFDPLVKMAVIHFQFESIHPFYDGNGRTGRIINVLYLILSGLQNLPVLYISKYINKNKHQYYQLLQEVREQNQWENWLLFMISAIESTSRDTIKLIKDIKNLMAETKIILKANTKFYSHELLNNLFKHPYTKVEFLMKDMAVSKNTATTYLKKLSQNGFLKKEKFGYQTYYINLKLFQLLKNL